MDCGPCWQRASSTTRRPSTSTTPLSLGVLGRVRGGGFTLYGLLPELAVDRDHVLPRALDGEFELVVFSDIWRTFGLWAEWAPQLSAAGVPMAVLDGSDRVEPYPYAGLWWRVPSWWFLPALTIVPHTSSVRSHR